MKRWSRRIRGALRMGLTWAVGWASVGLLIELVHNVWPNPLGASVDIWPALGLPAFFGGLAFSALLGIAARRRRFGELSIPLFAALGAAGGALVALGPAFMITVGFGDLHGSATLWQVTTSLMTSRRFSACSSARRSPRKPLAA